MAPLRMRKVGVAAAALTLGALLALGCAQPINGLVQNLPPETTLFVQGPVDTVNHVVHLYWFGSDPDGDVAGFELRLHNPAAPAETAWVFTTRADSLFTIFSPSGVTAPLFEVRAIDNTGLRDPTPAREDFTFSNLPPAVRLVAPPIARDSTFASVTLSWRPTDPDGDVGKLTYHVWLDGNEASPRIVLTTTYTIPSADFLQGGVYRSGYRTVYVQPIDDGGRIGAMDSTRWFVRAPVTGPRARLLIIDDVPNSLPAGASTDSMFTNTALRNLPADSYTVLRLEASQPFRSSKDVEQTMKQFECVIWYRGTQTTFPTLMNRYQDGLAAYLDAGGRLVVEGLNLINGTGASGALPENFVTRYFGSNRMYENPLPGNPADSTVAWGVNSGAVLRSTMFQDSLRLAGIFNGLRGLAIRDTNDVAIWARAGTLSQGHDYDIPVAVSVAQPLGGRAMVITVPLRAANGYFTVPRVLAKMFEQLGLTGP
jgi:hypothetical protein